MKKEKFNYCKDATQRKNTKNNRFGENIRHIDANRPSLAVSTTYTYTRKRVRDDTMTLN